MRQLELGDPQGWQNPIPPEIFRHETVPVQNPPTTTMALCNPPPPLYKMINLVPIAITRFQECSTAHLNCPLCISGGFVHCAPLEGEPCHTPKDLG